jgi:hypothetical protein
LKIVASAEQHMAEMEPRTRLGCQLMLETAADIIATAKQHPEHTFASGPVLEILVNVARSLSMKDVELHSGIS